MGIVGWISLALIAVGCIFFLAGSIGLWRLPDVYTRLHATAKADNVGLGLVILGLLLQSDSFYSAAQLVLIWFLVMLAGAAACHLISRAALRDGVEPWRKP